MSSSAAAVMTPADIDVSLITFGDIKTLDSGMKTVYLNYHNRAPIVFVTSALTSPFGLTCWEGSKYSIDLSVNTDPESTALFNKLKEIEERVLDEASSKSAQWFKKTQSVAILKELFSSPVKFPKDEKYKPTVKFTVPYKAASGLFDCDAYNNKKEKIDIAKETITAGSKINVIGQICSLWIARDGRGFGLTMKAHQMKVSPPNRVVGYAFIEDSDDEIDE